jgi:maleate isomerase
VGRAATSYQELVEELLARTSASRVTLRVDDAPGTEFPVRAEALAPGEPPLADEASFPIRDSPVFAWLERTGRVLVQEDAVNASPASSRTLIERFGVKAQMVAPVECDREIVALLAVHASARRRWSQEDRAAIEDAVQRLRTMLCL